MLNKIFPEMDNTAVTLNKIAAGQFDKAKNPICCWSANALVLLRYDEFTRRSSIKND